MRTKPPYARAAIADAAFSRSCSKFDAAMQPKSRKRPFNVVNVSGFQTDLSPHLAPTNRVRTNRPDASAAIAYAAFLRICGKLIAALQPGSWKRPFNGTNYGEFQTDSSPDHVR